MAKRSKAPVKRGRVLPKYTQAEIPESRVPANC